MRVYKKKNKKTNSDKGAVKVKQITRTTLKKRLFLGRARRQLPRCSKENHSRKIHDRWW